MLIRLVEVTSTDTKGNDVMQKLVVFEKKEKWWQSIVSDIFTYALAFLLLIASWYLGETLWTVVAISVFFLSITLGACESRAIKITSKEEAIKWANSLEE